MCLFHHKLSGFHDGDDFLHLYDFYVMVLFHLLPAIDKLHDSFHSPFPLFYSTQSNVRQFTSVNFVFFLVWLI